VIVLKPEIIFFSGPDGSGKTTQAKMVTASLLERGLRARYVWMRWFAFLSYPLLGVCKLLGYTIRERCQPIRKYYRNRAIAHLWLQIFLLDYIIYVYLKRLYGKDEVLVVDRFMPDIFVDVIYDTRLNPLKSIIGKFFLLSMVRLLRGRAKGFLMYIDFKTAVERRDDIPSASYILFRIPLYLRLANYLGIPVLHGGKSIQENFNIVMSNLCE